MNPRKQGDLRELSAIDWLITRGHPVWLPATRPTSTSSRASRGDSSEYK
jgi:hypothetical protein